MNTEKAIDEGLAEISYKWGEAIKLNHEYALLLLDLWEYMEKRAFAPMNEKPNEEMSLKTRIEETLRKGGVKI